MGVYKQTIVRALTSTVVLSKHLGFGDGMALRINVFTTLLANSFTLYTIRDSQGVGHSITDVMGDDINFTVVVTPEIASLKQNYINITITNNEGTSVNTVVKSLLQDYTPCVSL